MRGHFAAIAGDILMLTVAKGIIRSFQNYSFLELQVLPEGQLLSNMLLKPSFGSL